MKKVIIEVSEKLTPVKNPSKHIKLAETFIQLATSKIKKRMYIFIPLLNTLEFVPVEENVFLCTDGKKIFYNIENVIKKVKDSGITYYLEKNLMHIVFHGLLGHFEKTNWKDRELSWAVQDRQVERCVKKMYPEENIFGFGRFEDPETKEWDSYICDELYYRGLKDKELRKKIIKSSTTRDEHRYWCTEKIKAAIVDAEMLREHTANGEKEDIWQQSRDFLLGGPVSMDQVETQILKHLDKEMHKKIYGNRGLEQENTVEYTKASTNSYRDLLDKIVKLSESIQEEQELDKVLYQYGLELYGDVPLVEPEEISEKYCLNTIVFAVDTSGSCTELAEQFLAEMVAVFEEIKRIGRVKHICYMECDCEITARKDYYDLEEFIDFGKSHTFQGGGGTSFVPVFEYADKLVKDGEKVDALIYITDAEGRFPDYKEKPDYDVYLLVGENDWILDVPKWAECIRIKSGLERNRL